MAHRELVRAPLCRGVHHECVCTRYARISLVRRDLSRTVNPKLTVSLINAEDGGRIYNDFKLSSKLTDSAATYRHRDECTSPSRYIPVVSRGKHLKYYNHAHSHIRTFSLSLFSVSSPFRFLSFSLYLQRHTHTLGSLLGSLVDALGPFSRLNIYTDTDPRSIYTFIRVSCMIHATVLHRW